MLNISKQIYAAWNQGTTKYDLAEAEVIPLGDTANEKRKISNATAKYSLIHEHENVPLPGFTLYKADRKNWGSTDQTWLVIDPRGFLVRISTENLEKILHVTGITEGLIQEKCVWAREDSQTKMTLVPISSQSYIDAVKNTELLEGKVSIKDVNIGDTVIMQNGLQGVYKGTLSLYGSTISGYKDNTAKPQVYLRRQIVEIDPQKIYYQSDVKILKVVKKSDVEISKEESAEHLNNRVKQGAIFTTTPEYASRYYSAFGLIRHVSTHAVPKPKMRLEEIDILEAATIFNEANADSDNHRLVLETTPGNLYVVDFPYSFAGTMPATTNAFDILRCRLSADAEKLEVLDSSNRALYGTHKAPGTHSLDKFKKFYKIVKCVKNETYL